MKKRIAARCIFILVFACTVYFHDWLALIPLALLTGLTFLNLSGSKKARIFFALFFILDFFSGFTYFLPENVSRNLFFLFPSKLWMLDVIYILKYSLWIMFRPLAITVLLWAGYALEYIYICGCKKEAEEAKQKKITVSSVIAVVNILSLIYPVFVIFNNHWVDMEIAMTGISYGKATAAMVLYYLLFSAQFTIPLSIAGLIAWRVSKNKNSFGRLVNEIFLILDIMVIIGNIIIAAAWYKS